MGSPSPAEDELERKDALAGALVDFLEGWLVRELCLRFRTVADALYSETLEHRLLKVLIECEEPQSLKAIAARCGLSRTLMLPDRRLRCAIERMERSGIVSKAGPAYKPRYSLNQRDPTCTLLRKIFEKRTPPDRLVATSLRESFGSFLDD